MHQHALADEAVGLAGGFGAKLGIGQKVKRGCQAVRCPASRLGAKSVGLFEKYRRPEGLDGGIQGTAPSYLSGHQVEPLNMALCGAQHSDRTDTFLEGAGQRPVQPGGVTTPSGVYRVFQLMGRRFADHGAAIVQRHLAGAGTIKP